MEGFGERVAATRGLDIEGKPLILLDGDGKLAAAAAKEIIAALPGKKVGAPGSETQRQRGAACTAQQDAAASQGRTIGRQAQRPPHAPAHRPLCSLWPLLSSTPARRAGLLRGRRRRRVARGRRPLARARQV